MLLGYTYIYSIYGGNTLIVYILFAALFIMGLFLSVLFCRNTKLVLEHIKPEGRGENSMGYRKKRGGKKMGGISDSFIFFYF